MVRHPAVLLGSGVRPAGRGAPVAGPAEARPPGGQPGALALFLGQLGLRLREREQHAALHFADLDARPARGAAGRPGLRDEPAENPESPLHTASGHSTVRREEMTVQGESGTPEGPYFS